MRFRPDLVFYDLMNGLSLDQLWVMSWCIYAHIKSLLSLRREQLRKNSLYPIWIQKKNSSKPCIWLKGKQNLLSSLSSLSLAFSHNHGWARTETSVSWAAMTLSDRPDRITFVFFNLTIGSMLTADADFKDHFYCALVIMITYDG